MSIPVKTYVLNMRKDIGKRERISNMLAKHPYLDYIIFPATEGRKLTQEQLSSVCDWEAFTMRNGGMATLPALGCSLSHIRIYQEVAQQHDWALILEDDANIIDNISSQIQAILTCLNSVDAPIAVLLTPGFGYYLRDLICKRQGHRIYKLRGGQMTSGYLINRKAAQLLTKKLLPIKHLADDWALFVSMGLNLYGIVPHIISYPLEHGEIGLSQSHPSETFWTKHTQRLLGRLRRLMGRRFSTRNW